VRAAALCEHSRGTAGTFLARPAAVRGAARACLRYFIGRSRASAAGVTWTLVNANAPWGARKGHTSVIDAAGAIYVIGGYSGGGDGIYYPDVWASTDGGA
jgi:hypothetical protein